MNIRDGVLTEHSDHVDIEINGNTYTFETYMCFGEFGVALYTSDHEMISSCIVGLRGKYIESLLTESKFQNQGFGELLLSYIISEYDVETLSVMEFNYPAIHLYRKLGFEMTGRYVKVADDRYFEMELKKHG